MDEARITRIDVFKLDITRHEPFHISLGVMDVVQNVLVRIHAGDGLYGWGEGAPLPYLCGETQAISFEAARDLARLLVGKNPYAVEARLAELDRFLVHNSTTRSTFDMALYDLLAKRAGLPLYALLGGEKRDFYTDETIGLEVPETMGRQALDAREKGFPAVKAKLGTNRADDVARVEAIRAAIGPNLPLRIDANQGWDVVTAEQTLRALARFEIEFCEQPVAHWDHAGLRYLREHSPIPIMADESLFDHHDALRLAALGACDYFNIKLSKSGGIHTALKIEAIAQGAGLRCMLGCMAETRLGLSAAAHLVSARPNIAFADLDSAFNKKVDVVSGGITYDGGWIHLPDTPGHGADVRPDVVDTLESYTVEA